MHSSRSRLSLERPWRRSPNCGPASAYPLRGRNDHDRSPDWDLPFLLFFGWIFDDAVQTLLRTSQGEYPVIDAASRSAFTRMHVGGDKIARRVLPRSKSER